MGKPQTSTQKINMAIVTSNGNFLTLFTQPNGYTGGFFHDGKSLLRGCNPNEISFILETWGKDAPEGGIDPVPYFEEFEEEFEEGRYGYRYIVIPALGVDMAIGPIEDEKYGGWNCPYIPTTTDYIEWFYKENGKFPEIEVKCNKIIKEKYYHVVIHLEEGMKDELPAFKSEAAALKDYEKIVSYIEKKVAEENKIV